MAGILFFPAVTLAKTAVSLQRLEEYDQWKIHEKPFRTPKAPETWPSQGQIEARNLSVRYRAGLPLVLDDISFKIEAGQKCAIVGRTGSGKSTTLLAFMRILEMAKDERRNPLGEILIDGIPIQNLGLHELRRNLSIIPQDPFLMNGTIRFNLDPNDEYEDSRITEVLEQVSFLETIKA
jgi:ABC-type multidrug transport system fused ATPase/permease subunit